MIEMRSQHRLYFTKFVSFSHQVELQPYTSNARTHALTVASRISFRSTVMVHNIAAINRGSAAASWSQPVHSIRLAMSRLTKAANASSATTTTTPTDRNDEVYYDGPAAWQWCVRHWPDPLSERLVVYVCVLLGWAIAYTYAPAVFGVQAPLGRMALLFGGAQLCGWTVAALGVPDMLGMIGWGVLWANVGWADFEGWSPLEAALR